MRRTSEFNPYKCQFHQHFSSCFFVKKWFCTAVYAWWGFVFFGERKLTQKLNCKCWWNWFQVWGWRKKTWKLWHNGEEAAASAATLKPNWQVIEKNKFYDCSEIPSYEKIKLYYQVRKIFLQGIMLINSTLKDSIARILIYWLLLFSVTWKLSYCMTRVIKERL